LALLMTSAADMRRAATQKRLQSLRGGAVKQVIADPSGDVRQADRYIALVPKHLRPNFRRMMDSAGHAVSLQKLFLV
ncbi:hypothetical protein, partial [Enterococcus faecium]